MRVVCLPFSNPFELFNLVNNVHCIYCNYCVTKVTVAMVWSVYMTICLWIEFVCPYVRNQVVVYNVDLIFINILICLIDYLDNSIRVFQKVLPFHHVISYITKTLPLLKVQFDKSKFLKPFFVYDQIKVHQVLIIRELFIITKF